MKFAAPLALVSKPIAGIASLALGLVLISHVQVRAQTAQGSAEAEAQLASIRQAIVDAANERPTQVLSAAWIDKDGKLHETAHFQTDGEVRGVRVLSYLSAKPQANSKPLKVKVDMLPSAWRKVGKSDQHCEEPVRRLRQPLKVFGELVVGLSSEQSFYGQTLLNRAQAMWQEKVNSSSRWWPQAADLSTSHSYLRALTSDTGSEVAWGVRLSLSMVKPPNPPFRPWYQRLQENLERLDATSGQEAGPPWLWQLNMAMGTLSSGGTFEPQWHHTQTLTIESTAQLLSPQAWLGRLSDKLSPVIAEWALAIDKAWQCEPVQFQVSKPVTDGLVINAGRRSGLSQGDRLLLVAPEHIPTKIYEEGSMAHLRLAEVVQVGQNQTIIRQLAGPPASGQGRWLALPL